MGHDSTPNEVLIIRHGEKLGDKSSEDEGGPDLSIRGSSRAIALPSLFVPATPELACMIASGGKASFSGNYTPIQLAGDPPRFSTPDFLFATQASGSSNRPVETITPLSEALQLDIDDKHPDDKFTDVATDVLTNAKYAGKVVLICWHHGKIQELAQALGIANPPKWHGSVFDRVWKITYDNGTASLEDLPQSLLFGDSGS